MEKTVRKWIPETIETRDGAPILHPPANDTKATMEKLIRDRIPEIIKAHGEIVTTRKAANDEEYLGLLKAKLEEEVAEFLESEDPEELADILEVLLALTKAKGLSSVHLEALRRKKAEDRGGFEKRVILKS